MAQKAILGVDQADAGEAIALRQPQEIGRVIIAERPDGFFRLGQGQEIGP